MYEPVPIQCPAGAGGFYNNRTASNRVGVFDYTNPNLNNQFDTKRSNESNRSSSKTQPENSCSRKSLFNRNLDDEGWFIDIFQNNFS